MALTDEEKKRLDELRIKGLDGMNLLEVVEHNILAEMELESRFARPAPVRQESEGV